MKPVRSKNPSKRTGVKAVESKPGWFKFGFGKPPHNSSKKAPGPVQRLHGLDAIKCCAMTPEAVMLQFATTSGGLTTHQASIRLKKYGLNEIAREKAPGWPLQLWRSFVNPFVVVLVTLMVVSAITDVGLAKAGARDFKTIIVLSVMITLSTMLRFVTEYRSSLAAEALRDLVKSVASVERIYSKKGSGTSPTTPTPVIKEIPMSHIVPGDIVHLAAGDMVPADMRLVKAKDLFISQSALTGESIPVEKLAITCDPSSLPKTVLEAPNICLLGTNVVSGSATGIVLSTGGETYFGSMAAGMTGVRPETSFDKGVKSVSYLLIKFMLVMVPVIFLINGFVKHDWKEAFLFGIAVAVGMTPEMLPMIVSANLAKGSIKLAEKKCVVKNINAIQNLGAMDVLCTDKTGTLTRDKIVLERYVDFHGNDNSEVLDFAYLNSYHQTGLKNLLDKAVLQHVDISGEVERGKNWEKVDEIPFDFARRRMSVILRKENGSHLLICKGAVEEVLSLCKWYEDDGDVDKGSFEQFDENHKQEGLALAQRMNEEGLRVVAVAYREFESRPATYSFSDEDSLVFIGFVAFLDPPKESAEAAMRALNGHGVSVKVLTGDSDLIALNICHQVGIKSDRAVLGSEVEALSDSELAPLLESESIFAKLDPLQKSRIVRLLKASGHTVGYLGDGINDAASLRDADIGISVDTAADIAKESSDIIMLEKDLIVLDHGILEGRNVFGNIIKYIKMTASSNFGNVFSIVIGSAFLPFLPMLAIQLLVQNTLYDFSQSTIPWDRVDEDYLAVPRKWRSDDIARFMIWIGPISSIFDITTFAIMWFVFKANSPASAAIFHSGWFVEGLLSQTLIVHMIRTQKIPFFQSRATWPVILMTGIVMAVGIAIPFTGFGTSIGLSPLPLAYFLWLLGTLVLYAVLTQVVKTVYIRRFKEWL